MGRAFTVSRGAAAVVLVAMTAIALALRLVVVQDDLFADELSTYWIVSTNNLWGVVSTVHTNAEITPPLGFVASWLATQIELSPEFLRAPALIAGTATVPLVYLLGSRTVGRAAALTAAALTTLSPFMIYYSAEGRGYGLVMVFVVLSTLSMLLAVDRGGVRWWIAYAVFVCAAAYTHYTSIFVLAAQLAWVLWAHPEARRYAVVATIAAAVGYLPWLTGLRADLDSPTTEILSRLTPFSVKSVWESLLHWSVGYPYRVLTTPRTLPGDLALVLLGVGVLVGAAGIAAGRERVVAYVRRHDRRLILIFGLALATPLGAAVASAIGTNVFGTRNLASSWPFFALALATLLTAGRMPFRVVAATLAVVAFSIGAAKMLSSEHQRPDYQAAAEYVSEADTEVLIDAAALTPGPLTNFDLLRTGASETFTVGIPENRDRPFRIFDRVPPRDEIVDSAIEAADGGPITIVTFSRQVPAYQTPGDVARAVIDDPATDYRVVDRRDIAGFVGLTGLVLAQPPES